MNDEQRLWEQVGEEASRRMAMASTTRRGEKKRMKRYDDTGGSGFGWLIGALIVLLLIAVVAVKIEQHLLHFNVLTH